MGSMGPIGSTGMNGSTGSTGSIGSPVVGSEFAFSLVLICSLFFVHRERPLFFVVHKRSFVRWPIWIPPRVGDDPSIVAQF